MTVDSTFIDKLQRSLPSARVLVNEPMDKHTTFRIGGKADCLVYPSCIDDIRMIFAKAKEADIPVTVLGNGSNVLVSDKGIRGIVLCFDASYSEIKCVGKTITAQAGAILGAVSQFAVQKSLSGLEFAVGIPGSMGGAVFMNAGAYDGEMKNVIKAVTALTVDGQLKKYTVDELALAYRHSIFQDNGEVICEVELELVPGDIVAIKEKMAGFTERRISKQPLELPSAGSTFKRPTGYFAGTLIEQAGLKGFSVGGAQVSKKHAGFVVNTGGATAEDVLALIKAVQQRVREKFAVELEPEVKVIGE